MFVIAPGFIPFKAHARVRFFTVRPSLLAAQGATRPVLKLPISDPSIPSEIERPSPFRLERRTDALRFHWPDRGLPSGLSDNPLCPFQRHAVRQKAASVERAVSAFRPLPEGWHVAIPMKDDLQPLSRRKPML